MNLSNLTWGAAIVVAACHVLPASCRGAVNAPGGPAATSPSLFGGEAAYPGPAPGLGWMEIRAPMITASNAALAMSWTFTPQGLRGPSVRDVQAGRELATGTEVFHITLTNDQRYLASALVPDSPPRFGELSANPNAARLAGRIPGRQVEIPLSSADGRLRVIWRTILHDNANYIRQEAEVIPAREDLAIRAITWMEQPIPDARKAGAVDGAPIQAGSFFFGCEDPMAQNDVQAQDGGVVVCRRARNAVLRQGESWTVSFIVGVAPAGQMRRAFLYYLERERAHPYRPYLHYNSWYDTAWHPFSLNESNCLDAIRTVGERLHKQHGVVVDGMVFDDGWDDPKTLWRFHAGFPRGFAPLAELGREYHTRLGVWLSPFGGYGAPKEQRLKFGREQGYEINPTGFSLAGPKYYTAFKAACVGMIRNYGVNHFKFDGIATGMSASGGGDYVRDTEAMRRLMLELRQEDPQVFINLTTGSWPSPFWLRYADSVWRQGGDMGHAGPGPKQQQWLTYRDQETYRNIVRRSPLFPLNALMTQGVAYSRHGSAGDPTFNSAGLKDDVHSFFGNGTGLQELYIQPGKLTDADWRVLAEAAQWARARADVLVDTHWIGGDPSRGEVYGWAAWSPRQGIVTLRNPDDQPHEFALDLQQAFELPPGAPTRYTLHSPWAEDAARPSLSASVGIPLSFNLTPFQVLVLDATPVR